MEGEVSNEKKTILIVDDEQPIIDMLVYNLEKEGYNTLEATDGEKAVDIALNNTPDLILLDIMIPKMDGLSAVSYTHLEKEAKKKQKVFELKEIRVTPNIEEHDFSFKSKNVRKFIEDGAKVKITVRFRGREVNNVKLGEAVINKFKMCIRDSLKG